MNLETTLPAPLPAPAHPPGDSPTHTLACPPLSLSQLLESILETLQRHVILPPHAPEAIALWTLHTYAFHLRDVSTYLGIESPEKRCGKTTLLTVLSELCNRAVVASNISSPAFFRVIAETRPTLLIDEADSFLQGNDELRGILNSGYTKKTAHVIRVINQPSSSTPSASCSSSSSSSSSTQSLPSQTSNFELPAPTSNLGTFSTWCPKAIAAIGHLPDTLADRCIIIRMQRKTNHEQTQRLRTLKTDHLRKQCEAFAATHAAEIATAQPEIPADLNDRAADIWEPLFVLADIAGGDWPAKARRAAIALSTRAQETNPIGALLMDILITFSENQTDRLHTRTLINYLPHFGIRPWNENLKKPITDLWLAQQLRPYGIRPRTIRIGEIQAKGYLQEEMTEAFRRYIPKSEVDRFHEELASEDEPPDKAPSASPNEEREVL